MIRDFDQRYKLANELHARPFPTANVPGQAAYLAVRHVDESQQRDRAQERAVLIALLDRFGVAHPPPEATHYSGRIGRHELKWESHSEFVTYTVFTDGAAAQPFAADAFDVFPADWLNALPGERMASAIFNIVPIIEEATIAPFLHDWFVAESLAVSWVLDRAAVVATDFRIDEAGHTRFAVFSAPETGHRRLGRIVQRLCETEIYKTMSMLGFARARLLSDPVYLVGKKLSQLTQEMADEGAAPEQTLAQLLPVSADIEHLMARESYRFSATRAYSAIVEQRVAVLREERFMGRQTIAEFMLRRFDPAMRTVASTEARLGDMSRRAIRVSDLLRTRVDVERSAQNQMLLESMDKRADLQLRLQKTVEGLSVVAISYYAVNLATYMLAPIAGPIGIDKLFLSAGLTPLVVAAVWLTVRRIRRAMG